MTQDTSSLHLEKIMPEAGDFLPLLGTDYIELYVGNAKQAAHYYQTAFGFQPLAYAGLETGLKDRTSYVLTQGKINLVLTSPMNAESPINNHIVKKNASGAPPPPTIEGFSITSFTTIKAS